MKVAEIAAVGVGHHFLGRLLMRCQSLLEADQVARPQLGGPYRLFSQRQGIRRGSSEIGAR